MLTEPHRDLLGCSRHVTKAAEQPPRFALRSWLQVARCWLLVAGCWLLAAGLWLMAAGCWAVLESLLHEGCRSRSRDLWRQSGGLWIGSVGASGRCLRAPWGALGSRRRGLGRQWRCLWAHWGGPGGPWVGPWGILGRSLGGPRALWLVPGVLRAPQGACGASCGRRQDCPMSRLNGKTRASLAVLADP